MVLLQFLVVVSVSSKAWSYYGIARRYVAFALPWRNRPAARTPAIADTHQNFNHGCCNNSAAVERFVGSHFSMQSRKSAVSDL